MWIHVYPNWQTKFDFKKWWEVMFFLWNQHINSFIPIRRISLWLLIVKRMEIIVCPNCHLKFKPKNGGKWLWNQSIKLFTPLRRMSLWGSIMKTKEIILRIHVCHNWQTNFNSKNSRKRSLFYETKASMSFIPISKMSLWCPYVFDLIDEWTLILKMVEREVFLKNQTINIIYPN